MAVEDRYEEIDQQRPARVDNKSRESWHIHDPSDCVMTKLGESPWKDSHDQVPMDHTGHETTQQTTSSCIDLESLSKRVTPTKHREKERERENETPRSRPGTFSWTKSTIIHQLTTQSFCDVR
jgi:hypothetical protein